jgi:8-oxo-dGTP diphosphatase
MRENHPETIEVHVAGICFRETTEGIRVLLGKRQPTRALYPGLWECGGGQVVPGENFEEAVARQMREEFGVLVDRSLPFSTYEIETPNLPQKKIPGIKFVCFWKGYADGATEPICDGTEHSECRWQSIDDLSGFDFIPGVRDDIRRGWEIFSRNQDILQ